MVRKYECGEERSVFRLEVYFGSPVLQVGRFKAEGWVRGSTPGLLSCQGTCATRSRERRDSRAGQRRPEARYTFWPGVALQRRDWCVGATPPRESPRGDSPLAKVARGRGEGRACTAGCVRLDAGRPQGWPSVTVRTAVHYTAVCHQFLDVSPSVCYCVTAECLWCLWCSWCLWCGTGSPAQDRLRSEEREAALLIAMD